jgi:hypothetical protein
MKTRATAYRVNTFNENGYSTIIFFNKNEAEEYLNAISNI